MAKEKSNKKPFYKKWWVWVIAIIIIGALATGGEDTPTESAGGEKATPTESKKESKKAEASVGIGQVLKVGNVEFTVNGTSTSKNVGGEYGANSKGTYLLVDVTVTNKGNESITTDTSFFQLLVDGKKFDADGSASIYANEQSDFFLEQVNPDVTNQGVVVFDVSDEVIANPDLMLQVQTGFFGTETGTIKLIQ